MKRNRVVISGMGILAPNGIGLEEFWESLLAGRSGIGPITLFDASDLKSRIAGEVKNFDPLQLHRTGDEAETDGAPHPVRLCRDDDGTRRRWFGDQ